MTDNGGTRTEGKKGTNKQPIIRTKWKEAVMKVRNCIIENPMMSINAISKKTGICWETSRDCVNLLKDIGFYNCSKCDIWKARYKYLKDTGREMFDDFKEEYKK